MFSVSGWKISAPLATQIEEAKPRDPSKEGKKAKKRKLKHEENVHDGNVGEYWKEFVEGKATSSELINGAGSEDKRPEGEGISLKTGKKRKRKGNKDKHEQNTIIKDFEAATSVPAEKNVASKESGSKKKNKERESNQHGKPETAVTIDTIQSGPIDVNSLLPPEPKGLTSLQKSMRQKLASARFRHLNEALYTKPSEESLHLFKEDPSMFEDYHRGFAQQVEIWPENPVDSYVDTIITRGKITSSNQWKGNKQKGNKSKSKLGHDANSTPVTLRSGTKPLPRNLKGHSTVADLGCGTASLAYRLQPHFQELNLRFHSFDLSKPSGPSGPLVTIADISKLPLQDASVDVAIFCLALMGTNWLEFIDEAYRVLRWHGELWISEIKSRFGRVSGRRKPGTVPINSIGSLKKGATSKNNKDKKQGKKQTKEQDGIQDSDDEAELAFRVDDDKAAADTRTGTDVSAFVTALQRHGFGLDALPERQADAIDASNKMFVKMHFVKNAQPTSGKNVRKDEGTTSGAKGLRMGIKGKKYIAVREQDDDEEQGDDALVLKPCLYKIR